MMNGHAEVGTHGKCSLPAGDSLGDVVPPVAVPLGRTGESLVSTAAAASGSFAGTSLSDPPGGVVPTSSLTAEERSSRLQDAARTMLEVRKHVFRHVGDEAAQVGPLGWWVRAWVATVLPCHNWSLSLSLSPA
jgi:hypothetical protein